MPDKRRMLDVAVETLSGGALALGIKVGQYSMDMLLLDFASQARKRRDTRGPPWRLPAALSVHDGSKVTAAACVAELVTAHERAPPGSSVPVTQRSPDEATAAAAVALALASNSAACLLDLETVVLDGSFSPALREALRAAVQQALDGYDWRGVVRPAVLPGSIGSDARALGGALLPLYANFAPDREFFLKSA